METRVLGGTELRVPVLSFGTATFGGGNEYYRAWGNTEVDGARRIVDHCIDAGAAFFDTANSYSSGKAEEILGAAIAGRRERVLIASKSTFPVGDGPLDRGSSRAAIVAQCDASLRRLGTDYIDLYYMHGFDATTPVDETLHALDNLLRAGKIRAIGCSNFSGWHVMKSLATSNAHGWARYAVHQAYYSLAARDYEWELMPLALDQRVSTIAWSPLSGGALSGKIRRDSTAPDGTRASQLGTGRAGSRSHLDAIVDALAAVAAEVERPIPQVAINWVLSRPTVASVVIGARDEAQLVENLGSASWKLTTDQVEVLDRASEMRPPYPYWHQRHFPILMPPVVPVYRDDWQ